MMMEIIIPSTEITSRVAVSELIRAYGTLTLTAGLSRGIRVPIHHDPVSKTIHRNWIIGTRTIPPSMSLVVDGDGSEIPGLTKKSPNKLRGGGQASKVRDQDEQ